MKLKLDPKNIYKQYKEGKLTELSAIDQLVIIIENARDEVTRVDAVELLGKFHRKPQFIFKFLEDLLVSDSNDSIRNKAAYTILQNYFDKGLDAIAWALKYEESPKCLSTILKFLIEIKSEFIQSYLNNQLEFILKDQPRLENYYKFDSKPINNDNKLIEIFVISKYFLWLRQNFDISIEDFLTRDNKVIRIKMIINSSEIKKISDISALDYFSHLEELGINYSGIEEIDYLEKFPKLKHLDLGKNEIREITGLKNLSNIRELYLEDNQITEIIGLENLTELEVLNLSQNKLSEIKNLGQLVNLKKLFLKDIHINEIKGLENLTKLEVLDLSENKISEMTDLDSLINLKELFLGFNNINSIQGLEKLINLELLDLHNNKIDSIDGLSNLMKLEFLDLIGNNINKEDVGNRFPKIKNLYI